MYRSGVQSAKDDTILRGGVARESFGAGLGLGKKPRLGMGIRGRHINHRLQLGADSDQNLDIESVE